MRKVVVSYAGGRQSAYQYQYPQAVQLATIRADAMAQFGLADSTEGGNQVIFHLYQGGDRIDDLTTTVAAVEPRNGALALRLVREVIAG